MAFAPIAPAGTAVLQQDVVGGRASGAWDYPLSSQEKNWRLLALFQREVDDLQDEVAELQFDAEHWEDRCAKLTARSAANHAVPLPAKADEGLKPSCGAEVNAAGDVGDAGDAGDAGDTGDADDLKAVGKADKEADPGRPSPAEASMRRLRQSQSATAAAGEMSASQSARRQRRAMRREPFKALDWHRNWSRTYESIASDALDRVDSLALRIEAARIAGAAQTHVADLGEVATAHAQDLGEAVQAHAKDIGDSAEQLGADLADKAHALGESLAHFWGEAGFPFPAGAQDSGAGSSADSSRRPRRRASWALGDLFGATEAERPNGLEVAESWAVANSPAVDALWSAEPRPDARTEVSPCME